MAQVERRVNDNETLRPHSELPMMRRYREDETPIPGDHVIIMKGSGVGGYVLGTWQGYAVIEQWWGNEKAEAVPVLCEPSALLTDRPEAR